MRIEPRIIIQTLRKNNGRVRQTARELNISPGTVSNWRRRARSGSKGRLSDLKGNVARRSTRPKTTRTTTLAGDEQLTILRLRRERGHGALKLAATLGIPEKHRSVHRFLKQRGLTAPGKNYRRPRYQKTTHMYLKNVTQPGKLQMGVKYATPELSGLVHTAYLYAVIDIWSRYKQGVILPAVDQALAIEALKYVVPLLPFVPDFVQTDNGLEYQQRFRDYVTKGLGWQHHHIHKSSPNENAVIERSFRTDEEEFFWRMDGPAKDLIQLNAQYQAWITYYNEERLHLGIELKTPREKLLSVQ
ncbi:MAG TPA: integrase core domain-containing protein [Candidatus Saccharimonadales bacterium]|nr:integrase core domain-containing protein [Candidatus Saccharimonadales bacterium]